MSLRDKVMSALAGIGTKTGTANPETTPNNVSPLLHELFVAGEMRSYCNKRYDVAKQACINSGMFDLNGFKPGDKVIAMESELYALVVEVSQPVTKVDVNKFKIALASRGVSAATLREAEIEATVQHAPAKTFKVGFVDAT